MSTQFLCSCCGAHHARTMRDLLKHIRLVHADSPNFNIQCDCHRTFVNFHTFRNHIYSHHYSKEKPQHLTTGQCHESSRLLDTDTESNADGDLEDPALSISTDDNHASTIQRAAALWILKVRECHRIPQSVIESIIKDIESLYQITLESLALAVKRSIIENVTMDEAVVDDVLQVFDTQGPYGSIFPGLNSHHHQLKYCRENLGMVLPVQIVLGTHLKTKGSGSKRRLVESEDIMMYVPLFESLGALLGNETILSEVHNCHSDREGFMRDYCDSENFKSHPLFSVKRGAIQIFLYYDDVEVVNPLGSKRGIHKLGFFYYTLGNVSPKLRSRLSSIQLLAVVKTKHIKKYKMPAILKPIIDDVKKLESGHTLTVDGSPNLFFGTIAAISGDNLGSNSLGGFKEGSSANKGCRQCNATPDQIRQNFNESNLELRSKEQHIAQCDEMQRGNFAQLSVEHGINLRSPLLDLRYFDLCSGALVADVMHDILEGVLQYETKLLLIYYVYDTKVFSSNVLCEIMESYEFGYMEVKNRPTPVESKTLRSKDNLLKQNASQMWLLGRILPTMLGHLIPAGDMHWQCMLKLLQITRMLLSPVITADETFYVEVLIEEHHQEFKRLYPAASIIPKMHYMVHMPRLTRHFGPLVCHWAMRFEARHHWFKRLAQQLGNFTNLPYTLSMRFQQLQCYQQYDRTSVQSENLEVGPGDMIRCETIPSLNMDTPQHIYRARWVKVHGTEYKKPCGVLLSFNEDEPQFGEVLEILFIGGEVYFHLQLQQTIFFAEHFQAYVIVKTQERLTVCQTNLLSHLPVHLRHIKGLTISGQKGVILKHHISTL